MDAHPGAFFAPGWGFGDSKERLYMTSNEAIPLYRDGRHYDALNSFLVADIPFYVEEARRAAGLGVENPNPPAKGGKDGTPSA